jgi:predicted nucleotidyltransferase component of viral defense system
MIEKQEIDAKSEELGVHVSHVQRDYAFGWLLAALFDQTNPLSNALILKGGNCFRKAYFERARYSNDLDFSTEVSVDAQQLLDALKLACASAASRSGVEFLIDDSKVQEVSMADQETRMYDARVYFKSFYAEEDFRLRISMDVKEYDRIFLPVQVRSLIHSYSDYEQCSARLRCFKLEELLASKLKALLQRRHSPDLYDFVHAIFFQKVLDISRLELLTTFLKMTIYEPDPLVAKNLLLQLPFQIIRGLWSEYLVCPKFSNFSFDDAEQWFKSSIGDMFSLLEPRYATAGAMGWSERRYYYPARFRDTIIEAGRLKRLIRLVYDGLERRVEPYALAFKRRRDGVAREYFYGWDQTGGRSGEIGITSYTADKVQVIEVTEESFEPRYPIELAKAGQYFGKPFFSGAPGPRGSVRRSTRSSYGSSYGMEYRVECPYCGKTFKRSRYGDTKLNEHKDQYGNRCYGRVGHMVQ